MKTGFRIVALVLLVRTAGAATASSCSKADIDSAVWATSAGGTVNVPPGSCTWASALATWGTKNITLSGAGIGQTIITLTGTAGIGGNGVKTGTTASRISGFTFIIVGSSANDTAIYARGQNFRIDNNRFEASGGNSRIAIFMDGATGASIPHPTGVIDHNEFYNTKVLVHGNADLVGAAIWSQASKIGNPDQTGVVYVETNTFVRDNYNADVMEGNYAGRYVFRYNSVTNGSIDAHGITQEHGRAAKSWEIYLNSLNQTNYSLASSFAAIWPRSGTGVVWGNTVNGTYDHAVVLDNRRSFDTSISAYPPGYCNGLSNWDGNTTGQKGWPCRDQIGRGSDSSLWTSAPYPAQASEPVYVWNNTKNGALAGVLIHNCTSGIKPNGSCADIVAGRDYILGARPGYTPYQYPHPLVGSTPSFSGPANLRIVP